MHAGGAKALFHQIMWLMGASIFAQMHFEHSFCINCWYKDLNSPQVKHPPFIVHFAGCQVCFQGHFNFTVLYQL